MPRAAAEIRDTRDGLILRLFLAGVPYRDIGKNDLVQLSPAGVHRVVKRQMQLSAQRRDYLADNALDVHVERLESLFAANYQIAIDRKSDPVAKIRAGELCRRLLEQLGKVRGLEGSLIPLTPSSPKGDEDLDGEPDDELTAWRKKRENVAADGTIGGDYT